MTDHLALYGDEPVPSDLPAPVLVHPHPLGGVQALWRFPNDRGVSLIRIPMTGDLLPAVPGGRDTLSYGVEAALVEYPGPGLDWVFATDRPDPIIGAWLSPAELIALLRRVLAMPPPRRGLPENRPELTA